MYLLCRRPNSVTPSVPVVRQPEAFFGRACIDRDERAAWIVGREGITRLLPVL